MSRWRTALVGMSAVALCGLARTSAAAPLIDVSVADLYLDQTVIIEAPVHDTGRDGNVVRLRLGGPTQFVAVALVEGLLSNFPTQPEVFYAGKRVRVAGTLREFRNQLEITLHNAADIQVVDPAQPATGSAASNLDQQRLNTLEERVRHLQPPTPVPTLAPTPTLPAPPTAPLEALPEVAPQQSPSAPVDPSAAKIQSLELQLKNMERRLHELEHQQRRKR